ncbi:MogA/MoaB family molybdenum cofactor biosynthesis protein [Corynebacterium antarcticum]|uniref:Molybdopterin-binding protein n=1 Tax=Corynebacterium antarcticum TaxID=2800405 RepID=A0A9Q4GN96_9CORY|nr:molybdopterin-binding protein [Corynebacterium antarcticum]MCX7538601.1 molybdopterin-binding protein [Corynebacterium antarcticum]MCX7540606.1 molybdopterin-binding protein [Corynebacterium antarcticum]
MDNNLAPDSSVLDDFGEPDPEFLKAAEGNRPLPAPRRALVVLVTDQIADDRDDTDRLVTELLQEDHFTVDAVVKVTSTKSAIRKAIETAVVGGADLVITVGGTGVGPRDKTPDATRAVLDQILPGIAQALRASGLACGAIDAGTSRGISGVSGSTVIVNLASSRAAIRDGMATLGPLVHHIIDQLQAWSMD